jgi:Protein of unknown function (DUF3052)
MGAEADCVLRENGASHSGRALLETDELIFRGADGYRVKLPLGSLRNPRAAGGDLLLDAPSGALAIELGDKAELWAERIRSPKTLVDKLDLKPQYTVAIVGAPDDALVDQLRARVRSVTKGKVAKGVNVVFLWADTPVALKRLASTAKTIARDGAIWVIHAKGGASKVKDTDIFAVAKKAGLTATKVARVSETHTAEKLVIPVAKR